MMRNVFKRAKGLLLASVLLLASAVGSAQAATFDLCAGQSTVSMPDGQVVTIWGFGLDTGGQCVPTIPGPTLRVPDTDTELVVNLRNTLSEPVSLNILGQQLNTNAGPVWDTGAAGARPNLTARVRSFSHEAAAGGGTASYQWGSVAKPFKAGTYLLQSGTNPAKQVQMGLSAPVVKDAAAGVAYADNPSIAGDQSVPYAKEVILVFQDMDPAIHAAVAAGTYGAGGTITSSAYREPSYFLINGMAHPNVGLDPVNGVTPINVGDRTLVRMINAGGETFVPQILNSRLSLVAEDGTPLRYAFDRYGFELNPAKTLDAVFTPDGPGRFPVLDGRLNVSNAGASPGGMVAFLLVGGAAPGADTVTIVNVVYSDANDTLLVEATSSQAPNVVLNAGYGNLLWDAGRNLYRRVFSNIPTQPASVTVTSSAGGSATYYLPAAPASDTVTIANVVYSATQDQLLVEATSTSQPGVTLSAPGYGNLLWDAGRNLYRRVFSNVATQPASVTVNSSGGGSATYNFPASDTVTIVSAVYSATKDQLLVEATSTSQPGVTLSAQGYGNLLWDAGRNLYRRVFSSVPVKPANVTVESSGGGSATQAVP